MTQIQIELPEATAKAVREAGLLSSSAIQALLEGAMRRHPSRLAALARLLAAAPGIEFRGCSVHHRGRDRRRGRSRARSPARPLSPPGR